MKLDINKYPGSKNANGLKQFIINRIPEYSYFYELFAGSARISRELAQLVPKVHSAFELDVNTCSQLEEIERNTPNFIIFNLCGLSKLNRILATKSRDSEKKIFIYLDPPYLKTSIRSRRNLYTYSWEEQQHIDFLEYVCRHREKNIMISHYDCELYNHYLATWKKESIQVMSNGGVATETIYMNYDPNKSMLATTHYLGENFTDRQRIKRRKESYLSKFKKMSLHERQAILQHIQNNICDQVTSLTSDIE